MTDWTQHFHSAARQIEACGLPVCDAETAVKLAPLAVLVLALLALALLKPRRWRGRGGRSGARILPFRRPHTPRRPQSDLADPAQQMTAIARAGFQKARLLNKEEARLLPLLERVAREVGQGHRVMAQTSLGEVLRPCPGSGSSDELKAAYASINSKRLDFAIFDRTGFLACAVEYQGSGHYQGNAFMRDAVKKEALPRASVPLVEVPCKFEPSDLQAAIRRLIEPAQPGSEHRHTAVHM